MGDACWAAMRLIARSARPVLLGGCMAGWGLGLACAATEAVDRCLSCHSEKSEGFSEGHGFGGADCTACHGGDGEAGDEYAAHQGLLAFPGNLSNAARACGGCHGSRVASVSHGFMATGRELPFDLSPEGELLGTERFGTPLWHIEVRPDGLFLHRKVAGGAIRIPQMTAESHPAKAHERLTCTACHSQWAAQCFGCHVGYDPAGRQWDHVERRATPGKWLERRWGVRNGPPPLGVTAEGRVAPFVPGMILSVEHPSWDRPMFARRFASIAPHTTGASRAGVLAC